MNPTRWFTRPRTVQHDRRPDPPPAVSVPARQAVLDTLAAERDRYAQVSRRLSADSVRARACEAEIADLHRDATRRRHDAEITELVESTAHDRRVRALEAQLEAGAPECIDRFLAELLDVEQATRLATETRVSPGHRDPVTLQHTPIVATNGESVTRRLAAIRAARAHAEAFRLEAIAEAEVLARLAALRDGIPEIEPVAIDQVNMLFSPGERRQIEWQAAESSQRRWSGEPWN